MLPENKSTFLPKQQGFFEKSAFFVGRNLNVTLNEKVRREKHLMGTQDTKRLANKKQNPPKTKKPTSFQH